MLKKRLIASIVIKDGLVVQSIGFEKFLPIGKIAIAIEFLENWDVDEIVILDISASKGEKAFDRDIIKKVSEKCFIPITIGGGIKSIDDIRNALLSGADKVIINSSFFDNENLLVEAKNIFGSQCLIAGIDVKYDNSLKEYKIYRDSAQKLVDLDILVWMKKLEALGIGEILINSIDRDGAKKGYDIELIKLVSKYTNLPIIAMGGAGKNSDFIEVFKETEIGAVAAGNIFHFIEHSTVIAKSYLKQHGIDVRVNREYNYLNCTFYRDRNIKVSHEVL